MKYNVVLIKETGKIINTGGYDTLEEARSRANKVWYSLPMFNQLTSDVEVRGYEHGYDAHDPGYETFVW